MEQLKQTQASMNDLFVRLAAEKAALDRTTQQYAERDAQSRELLNVVGNFAEWQRRAQDDVRSLLKKRSESDRALEEQMARMFKEKTETDERIGKEIEEVFEESVRGAQETEKLLRRFNVAMPPADDSETLAPVQPASDERPRRASISSVSSQLSSFSGLSDPFANSLASPTLQSFESVDKESVSLTPLDTPKRPSSSLSPSSPPDAPEAKPEPQEWDFFDYEEGVVWGSEGKPPIKPPTSFAEFCESEVAIPADPLPCESVDTTMTIPIPEWTIEPGNNVREITVSGVRVLKGGNVELSVRMFDSRTKLGALTELTQSLTDYHRTTTHVLTQAERNFMMDGQWMGRFVSVQSSYSSAWHRGQILSSFDHTHGSFEILFIDSGFHEIVNIKSIRSLPTLFRFLPQQARKAHLSFVNMPVPGSQHHAGALEALRKACAGHTLLAELDHMRSHIYKGYMMDFLSMTSVSLPLMDLRLMDLGVDTDDILMSINGQLLRDGLATIDIELCRSSKVYQSILHELANTAMKARNDGVGMYQRQKAVEGHSGS